MPSWSAVRGTRFGSASGRGPGRIDGASIRRADLFSSAIAFRAGEALLSEVADGVRGVTLAVVELRRELGDGVAAVNRGEDLKFDTPEYGVTYYETWL